MKVQENIRKIKQTKNKNNSVSLEISLWDIAVLTSWFGLQLWLNYIWTMFEAFMYSILKF